MKLTATLLLLLIAPGSAALHADDRPGAAKARGVFMKCDAELNKVYQATIAGLDKSKAAGLREDETGWLQYRDENATATAARHIDTTRIKVEETADYWEVKRDCTQDRIAFLKAYAGKKLRSGIDGYYTDSRGGGLNLDSLSVDQVHFSLNVIRGPELREASIAGSLWRDGDTGHFKDEKDPDAKAPPCELDFSFIDDHIVKVEEKVPAPFTPHGIYNGLYYRKAKPTLKETRAKFEERDAVLNEVYQSLLARLDKTGAAQLRENERMWVVYRSDMAKADAVDDGDNPGLSADYWESMADYTDDRLVFLRAWTGKDLPPGIAGTYSDSFGGTLTLTQGEDGIDFELYVARGRDHNEGEMAGTLHFLEGKAFFRDKPEAGDNGPASVLGFFFVDGHTMKIIDNAVSDNNMNRHIYFAGDYFKIEKPKP